MRFKYFSILIVCITGSVLALSVGAQAAIETGGGFRYNTFSMTEFNQKIVFPFNEFVTDINDLISLIDGVSGSLNMPGEIHSGIGYFGEARVWLLPFMGVGFEIEQLAASSTSSGTITVQTGADSLGTVNVNLGVNIKATGFSGEMLFGIPLDFLKLVGKFAVGYYPTTLRFYASGSVKPSGLPLVGSEAPDKIEGDINLTYNGSGIGFKGLFGLEIPLDPLRLGFHLGYRFLRANMGDITGDGNPNFLDFSGMVIGMEAGMGF